MDTINWVWYKVSWSGTIEWEKNSSLHTWECYLCSLPHFWQLLRPNQWINHHLSIWLSQDISNNLLKQLVTRVEGVKATLPGHMGNLMILAVFSHGKPHLQTVSGSLCGEISPQRSSCQTKQGFIVGVKRTVMGLYTSDGNLTHRMDFFFPKSSCDLQLFCIKGWWKSTIGESSCNIKHFENVPSTHLLNEASGSDSTLHPPSKDNLCCSTGDIITLTYYVS